MKLEDRHLAKSIGVFAHPSLVIFRQYGREAVIYAGDLKSQEAILEWLLIQKDPENEAIEDLEGEALTRAVRSGGGGGGGGGAQSAAVAVFVYRHENCDACLAVLQSLENIDDDTGRQDIKMIKTTDPVIQRDLLYRIFKSF